MKKQILSFLLVLVMLVGMLPVSAFATESGIDIATEDVASANFDIRVSNIHIGVAGEVISNTASTDGKITVQLAEDVSELDITLTLFGKKGLTLAKGAVAINNGTATALENVDKDNNVATWTTKVTPEWTDGEMEITFTVGFQTSSGWKNEKNYVLTLKKAGGSSSGEVAVESVTLDKTAAELDVGEAVTLTATVTPDNATDKTVTWESSDSSVATVENGVVTGVAAGDATITAKAGSKEVTCTVTVKEAASCEHNWNDATCSAPKTCSLCGATDGEADPDAHKYVDGKCEYCKQSEPVEDIDIVTGDAISSSFDIRVSNVHIGAAGEVISNTASADGKITVQLAEDVSELEIVLNLFGKAGNVLGKGAVALNNGTPTELENIDKTNNVATWTTRVTPEWTDGEMAITFTVGVRISSGWKNEKEYVLTLKKAGGSSGGEVAVESVTVAPDTAEVEVGKTVELTATVLPENATDKTVTWTSSNEAVATVSDGVVTAVSTGEATITAKAGDKEATCTVTVKGTTIQGYNVTLPTETVGYTVAATEGSASPVAKGGSYSFTVTIADGYEAGESFAVKANDVVLTANEGIYTIENVTADQTVTVEGVEEKQPVIESTPFSQKITVPSNGHSSWGYVSGLTLSGTDGSIYEAYWSSESNPFVLDVILGQDTDLDAAITATFSAAGMRAPTLKNGTTTVTLENGKGTITMRAEAWNNAVFYPHTDWTINLTVDDGSAANRPTYAVTLPTDTVGYTVAAYNSESPVIEGRAFSFKVTIDGEYKKGENFKVLVNGEELTGSGDVYTITNITEAKTVTVEGVVPKTLEDKNVVVIAPADSTIASGRHYSYFKYDFSEPLEETILEDGRIQKVFPAQSGRQGFVRVQHPDGVTYWNFDGLTAGSVFEITEEMLFIGSTEFTKETVYANFEKNVKDKADLYLTANEKGWLDLKTGDTWNLNVFRNFLSLGNTISNDCLALPDVEYKVITVDGAPSSGVITVTPNENNSSYAEIKAVGAGTAIILVSYDAVYNADGEGGQQWSAIWPENTGVIVVTVDAEDAAIATNMTVNEEANSTGKQVIDAEHDILFYVGSSGAEYSFTPEASCTVTVNRSSVGSTMTFSGFSGSNVETAEDGTVTVKGLTTGTHIIKVEKDGQAVYQVVRARQVTCEVLDSTGAAVNAENPAEPGEKITIQFHGLVSPMEKLSGVYNANFGFWYNGEDGTEIRTSGGTYGVYAFSSSSGLQKFTVSIPATWTNESYSLTDGAIKIGGFGSSAGAHRTTTYIAGKEVNTNASGVAGVLAVLPDLTIPVNAQSGADIDESVRTEIFDSTTDGTGWGRTDAAYVDKLTLVGVQVQSTRWEGDTCYVKLDPETAKDADIGFIITYVAPNMPTWANNLSGTLNGEAMTAGEVMACQLENGTFTAEVYVIYSTLTQHSGTKTFVLSVAEDAAVDVESITLDQTALELEVGGTETLAAAVLPDNATDKTVTWTSSNEAVATVADGVVTAVAAGEATITAKAGDKETTCTVTVKETTRPVESVTLNKTSAELEVGQTLSLTATVKPDNATDKTVTWTSSNEAVATVVNGVVTAAAEGTATITAKAGEKEVTCVVTVKKAEASNGVKVYLSMSHDADFMVGDQTRLAMALREVTVPWFDLSLYGMEEYTYEEGKPTVLHLYIYATEVYYCGLAPETAGQGYLYEQGLMNDLLQYEGSAGSIYFLKFWGQDCNLNYYVNYQYPAKDGWGVTADQLVLANNDIISVGHFTDWSFFSDSASGFNYLDIGGENLSASVQKGEEITLQVYLSNGNLGGGTSTGNAREETLDIYYAKADTLTNGVVSQWNKLGTTDSTGKLEIAVNMEPGTYVLAMPGQVGAENPLAIVSAPGSILLTVLESEAGDQVQDVINLIDAIGEVTLNSEAAITAARNAYNALTEDQQAAVTNYTKLTDAEAKIAQLKQEKADQNAADAVTAKINAIGTVTLDSKAAIEEARAAYDALTEAQKALVSEETLKKLTDAEAAYAKLIADEADKAAAKAVEENITAIGTVTLDSEQKITAARQAYDALTDTQKQLVGNYEVLTTAEKKLAELKDEAAADAVEAKIAAIGTVTLASEDKIKAARAAYDALTDTQKALVENLSVLEAAEEALELLKLAGTDITDIYKTTGDYLAGLSAPGIGSTNGEWRVIGLVRAGREVPDSFYEATVKYVQDNIDENGRLHTAKSTDNSRLIVALTAIGKDVTDVGGYDLLSGLNDMAYIGNQGINGTIWALIAFDSHDYEIPAGDVTREKLVQAILDAQLSGGGWALAGTVGDPDMTGMALQALAPYYGSNAAVTTAVDKALTWLTGIQAKDGTFTCSEGVTSESLSQVITALTALGINPETDSRFVKNGVSAVDALSKFYVEGGGFKHGLTGERNMMATEQGYYALVSYYRLLQGKTSLYDMSDVTIQTAAKDQEAADAVEALIDAIGTVTTDSGDKIKVARNAYDALTDAQKALVENYKTLTDAEAKYAELVKTAEDEAAAKAVEDKIDAIGTVTLDSGDKIKAARNAYEALTDIQKALVSNLDKLEDAEKALAGLKDEAAADAVEKLIDAIGTVTLDSEDKITAARNAYDALTEAQKKLVENYKTLTDAESKLNELKSTVSVTFTLLGCSKHGEDKVHTLAGGNLSTWIAKKTYMVAPGATVKDVLDKALAEAGMTCSNPTGNYVESINGIGEFTNGSNSGWMYTLNGTHPNLGVAEQTVKNGDVIVFHYTDDYTKEEGSQGFGDRDEEAAEKVEKLIGAIGTVTLNSKSKIDAARKAYDALTYTQKQLVGNYAKLTAAESKYAELKAADDEKKAEAVEDLIDAIMEGSSTFEDDVKTAQKAYNNLTVDQKKLVDNYYKLVNYLKTLADEEDKKAAEAVDKLIDAIGTVTKDSEDEIKAAREAYEKLTDEQKELVEKLSVLEAAEKRLEELKALAGVEDIYKTTGDYLEDLGIPGVGSVGGEWMVIGLTRSGRKIENVDAWYDLAVKYVQENIDENGRLHQAKSTENARLILALTAIGKEVTNVGGYNLLHGLNSMEYIQKQGINGPIWALLAFDSGNYPVPEGDVSRAALIQVLLDAQLSDGGWALTGTVSDPDITGMALQALAPYYKTDAEVKAAVEEAVETLSDMQAVDGSYASIDGTSSESISQVIVALAALGIDADKDARFIKNGVSALDALCAFYVEGGGFKHIPTGKLDGMATEQAYYALAAYFRMLDGKSALYNMTDVIDLGGDKVEEEPTETLPVETEPVTTEPTADEDDTKGGFPWWLLIVIVVLAGAIVVLVIISKPKKHKYVR